MLSPLIPQAIFQSMSAILWRASSQRAGIAFQSWLEWRKGRKVEEMRLSPTRGIPWLSNYLYFGNDHLFYTKERQCGEMWGRSNRRNRQKSQTKTVFKIDSFSWDFPGEPISASGWGGFGLILSTLTPTCVVPTSKGAAKLRLMRFWTSHPLESPAKDAKTDVLG